jgi:hypothetical protein
MINRSLQRRLAKLGIKAGINAEPLPLLIVRRIVEPNGQYGGALCHSDRAEANGHVWHRKQDERQDSFEQRVIAEMRENNCGRPQVLTFFPAERGAQRVTNEHGSRPPTAPELEA